MKAKQGFIYLLIGYVVFVFVQSLFFKFTGSQETEIIFNTIADWMKTVGLGAIAPVFAAYGGYVIGGTELVASGLMINPKTRNIGALIGLAVITGAIFFHLFTPLGVDRVKDAQGNTDGGVLFYMACGVWLSCALILLLNRNTSKQ